MQAYFTRVIVSIRPVRDARRSLSESMKGRVGGIAALPRSTVSLDNPLGQNAPTRETDMDSREKETTGLPGAPEGARRATAGAPGERAEDRGRFSSLRKLEAVLRFIRSESLDTLSGELGVTGATLGECWETFVSAGQSARKSRPADERDDEIQRLRAEIGEITMANELRRDRARAAEAADPLAPRRSRS
ncbi:MAG TPA: hypothetical protein VFI25_14080 [Planctomycetota bacterium]|nr:hypothetical protein [Planctomycetota bacterium]